MNKKQLFFLFFILIILVFRANMSYSMNDTDGVIAVGLFPLQNGSKNIELISVKTNIVLRNKEIYSKKAYKFRNNSIDGVYQFGSILCYNCLSNDDFAITFRSNDTEISQSEQYGYLRDKGSFVEVVARNKSEISNRLKTVDGTIVGHKWVSFEIPLKSKKIYTVELEICNQITDRNVGSIILNNLSIYTEKFWSRIIIPEIEFSFTIKDNIAFLQHFIPDGSYNSKSPDIIDAEKLVWKFKNYKTVKEMYRYQHRFVHPYAIKYK